MSHNFKVGTTVALTRANVMGATNEEGEVGTIIERTLTRELPRRHGARYRVRMANRPKVWYFDEEYLEVVNA